ncbi:MAG: DUF3426 domain-containing protein [Deltaproteobacteria bacterium]|jgi:hypothetical protein|nr:DUF3426 domain-containing protein [Deltaproteobacteria bacterium]
MLAALLALSVTLAACGAFTPPGGQVPPTDTDISEMSPHSLKVPVMDYGWTYLPGNNHISIQGTVVNGEERPLQGVILSLTLYDQNGSPIAYGETYVSPSYLTPGAKGTFSVMSLVSRQKGVTHTRLITNAQTRSIY